MRRVIIASLGAFAGAGLLGGRVRQPSVAVTSTPPTLVAEAAVRWDSNHNPHVDLPVIIHGHTVALIIGFGFPDDVVLTAPLLSGMGITLTDKAQLDSLTVGTTVARHLTLGSNAPNFSSYNEPNLPPIVGYVGNKFLARYDIVYDGPASRVRLYTRLPRAAASSADNCTPIAALPGYDDRFTLQVDGHPLSAMLVDNANWTKLNLAGAHLLGLTQHSPNIRPAPPGNSDDYGHRVKYVVTDLTLAVGAHHVVADTVAIFPQLDDGTLGTPEPPLLLLNPDGLRHAVITLSHSTKQVCLDSTH